MQKSAIFKRSETNCAKRKPQLAISLKVANSSTIPTYNKRKLLLDIGLHRTFPWSFFKRAKISQLFLRINFLRHFQVLVGFATSRLVDTETSFFNTSPPPQLNHISLVKPSNEFDTIHSEFPRVSKPLIHKTSVKYKVQHHIFTTRPSTTFAKAGCLSPEKSSVRKPERMFQGKYKYSSATGDHLFTWSPNPRVPGASVVIIRPSTKLRNHTVIQYHTSKIFQLVKQDAPSFLKLIWCAHMIRLHHSI